MKKVTFLLLTIGLSLILTTCAFTVEPPPPDYLTLMAEAAAAGDIQAGRAAEAALRAAVQEAGIEETPISFDELYLLSQFIYLKAGAPQLSQELRMCTGEVALNRMASPEFPNTMRGVFLQMGGEAALLAEPSLTDIVPSKACVDAAMRLLKGDRMMEPSVVYQSDERQGDVFATFADKLQGFTYFCYSENRALYPSTQQTAARSAVPDAVTG